MLYLLVRSFWQEKHGSLNVRSGSMRNAYLSKQRAVSYLDKYQVRSHLPNIRYRQTVNQ